MLCFEGKLPLKNLKERTKQASSPLNFTLLSVALLLPPFIIHKSLYALWRGNMLLQWKSFRIQDPLFCSWFCSWIYSDLNKFAFPIPPSDAPCCNQKQYYGSDFIPCKPEFLNDHLQVDSVEKGELLFLLVNSALVSTSCLLHLPTLERSALALHSKSSWFSLTVVPPTWGCHLPTAKSGLLWVGLSCYVFSRCMS